MNDLEMLYEMAFEIGINIHNFHFSETKKSACFHNDDYKAILMDKPAIKTTREEKSLLAEELGHYETGSLFLLEATSNTPLARSNQIWGEGRSKNWAAKKLVPLSKLQDAFDKGIVCVWELAELFNVDRKMLDRALTVYQSEGAICINDN